MDGWMNWCEGKMDIEIYVDGYVWMGGGEVDGSLCGWMNR